MKSYRIVVPSRKRQANMQRLLSLLPTATILVDKEERDAYLEHVPEDQLDTHDSLSSLTKIRNHINSHYEEDVVVQCDDDLRKVTSVMSGTATTDPDVILDIIENAVQVASDYPFGLIGWNAVANPMQFQHYKPIRLVGPVRGCFCIANEARKRKFDTNLVDREDFDFVMQALLKDRIVYIESRFYFDFGNCLEGTGGLQGKRTDANLSRSNFQLAKRWGAYCSTEIGRSTTTKSGMGGMSIKVARSQRSSH